MSSVRSGNKQACAIFGGQPVSPDTPGFLASVTAAETGVGMSTCPWLIEAQSGQKVNLTLFSFGSAVGDHRTTGITGVTGCDWTIVVKEDSNVTVQLPGCSGLSREKLVYTSRGNGVVQVHLQTIRNGPVDVRGTAQLLLRYQGKLIERPVFCLETSQVSRSVD